MLRLEPTGGWRNDPKQEDFIVFYFVLQTIKLQYRTGFAQTGKCSYAQTIHVHNLK